jgi:hypothetical protein
VVVTSDKKEGTVSVMKSEIITESILKKADVENNGYSWIAAEIQVRYNIAVTIV